MFETDEEVEMLYTLSVNLEYFEKEMERASSVIQYGKISDNYRNIAKLLNMACTLVKENMEFKKVSCQ